MIIQHNMTLICGIKYLISMATPWILQKLNLNSVRFWETGHQTVSFYWVWWYDRVKGLVLWNYCWASLCLRPTGFFVCGLNLTLPENARILKYILRMCDNFANVVRRTLPRLLRWLKQQGSNKPNIVASDLASREDFVSTVIQLNISKGQNA